MTKITVLRYIAILIMHFAAKPQFIFCKYKVKVIKSEFTFFKKDFGYFSQS